MDNYIVYIGFPIKASDIEDAEKTANAILKNWENRPVDCEITVRGTGLAH